MRPWHAQPGGTGVAGSLAACLGAVLERSPEELPVLGDQRDPATLAFVTRWLGRLGMGLARVADPASFSWPGPWIARVGPPGGRGEERFVVMFGQPSGVVWDPAGDGAIDNAWITEGYLLAATDIALAPPPLPAAPTATGRVESICLSAAAGADALAVDSVAARAGRGLEGDRYNTGDGTFASGAPGTALTLIEAEVCESFAPPLGPGDHRRNLVTRGLALNDLLGHEFTVGEVRCRGMRLCEPCTVLVRYAGRPVLRELAHRGGLRADILTDGRIRVGDPVQAYGAGRGQAGAC